MPKFFARIPAEWEDARFRATLDVETTHRKA